MIGFPFSTPPALGSVLHPPTEGYLATYRGAIIRDTARLSDELGNSAAVVAKHYRDAKLEAEARAYFAIRPGEPLAEPVPIAAAG